MLRGLGTSSGGGGGTITGSGTAGRVAKFATSTAVGDSVMVELGSAIGIDCNPDYINAKLDVNGNIIGRYNLTIGSSSLLTASNITSALSTDLVLQRAGVEAARIIAGGKVGFGNTDPATLIETYGTTGIRASSDTVANVGVFQYSTDTTPATVTLRKARGTRAAQTTVATGDAMGSVNFTAYGGTSGSVLSSISGNVVTYTSNANISSNLTFGTSASGAATPTTRLTIDEAGISTFTGPVRATGTAATAPAFTGSDTDTGMYFPANNQVRLSTNGSFALAVDASQRVGIGQATPAAPLHVLGTSITAASTTTASAGIHRIEGSATNALFVGSFSDSPFGMCLQTNSTSYPLVLQPAGGSVGINVTSPTTNTLDVSTAGWGVKLASTPGNGNANTLDCYAEGSYTATAAAFIVTGSSPTQPLVVVQYTRIGRLVTLTGKVTLNAGTTNWSSSIGGANITLPTGTTFDPIDGQLGAGLLWSTAGTPAVYSGVFMHPTNRLIYFPTVTPATTLTHYFILQYMTAT